MEAGAPAAEAKGREEKAKVPAEQEARATEPPTKAKPTEPACSWAGANCNATGCCKEPGLQCFRQNAAWAECRAACTVGPDPTHWDGRNWTCEALGARAPGALPKCSEPGADCSASRCCSVPGMQCYQKQPGWATCKPNCMPGIDLTDGNADPWNCVALGLRAPTAAPWVAGQCTATGQDCRTTRCCAQPGDQCYERDVFWAQCKPTCTPGPDPNEPWNPKRWSCNLLGSRTPALPPVAAAAPYVAKWVANVCAKVGEDCRKSTCCVAPGTQCYAKNEHAAGCKATCMPGADLFDVDEKPWNCTVLGPRTPGQAEDVLGKSVSKWVAKKCTQGNGEGCFQTGCCAKVGQQCYAKDDSWAACLSDCAPGQNRSAYGDLDGRPWSCKEIGIRTPRAWGHPSIYCFAVVRTEGYELGLVQSQLAKGVGIFSCDDYAVFSSPPYRGRGTTWWHPADEVIVEEPLVPLVLGVGPLGRVESIPFKPTFVGTSLDQTAGNTELFLRVWAKVQEHGHYLRADWTVKADPDAVLFPSRLRSVLLPYNGLSTYIVNCDKPGMAPMMFGSVEMFSRQALQEFFKRQHECTDGLSWKVWGEDYFIGKCLDMLGVTRTNQFSAVSDGVCKGINCADPHAAAFHPRKDIGSWMACLNEAQAVEPASSAAA